ncbi:hypothetical protein FACS1894199_09450 [Bacteroidia bacterium]|nr:hypothetical protein FACS1894199_09450 [Bacteroidia bacterium]
MLAQTWFVGAANPGDIYSSGNSTPSITATLNAEGLLDISGTGDMVHFTGAPPWQGLPTNVISVTIDNRITRIGNYAFFSCASLSSVTIPDGINSIGNDAFRGCTSLQTVSIGKDVNSIGTGAFVNCTSLDTLNFNAADCNTDVFNNGLFSVLNIGKDVKKIYDNTFYSCSNLTTVNYSADSCTYMKGASAFWNCSYFQTLNIIDGVVIIPDQFFQGYDHFSSISIPNSVKRIGNEAFRDDYGILDVYIGKSVNSIGNDAFSGCINLNMVKVARVEPLSSVNMTVFLNTPYITSSTLIVPAGSLSAYSSSTAGVWYQFFQKKTAGALSTLAVDSLPTHHYLPSTSFDSETLNYTVFIPTTNMDSVQINATPAGLAVINPTDIGWHKMDPQHRVDTVKIHTSEVGIDVAYEVEILWGVYKVTFNAPGATPASIPSYVCEDSLIRDSDVPAFTRDGHRVAGWYKDAACTIPWDLENDKVTVNASLFAKWIRTYKVKFTGESVSGIPEQIIDSATKLVKPTNPTRPNYSFYGWYKSQTFTDEWKFATDLVNVDTTLYAKWVKQFTVTFDVNGGKGTQLSQNVDSTALSIKPKNPTRAGYDFLEWLTADGNSWEFNTPITADITLKASWVRNAVPIATVTFVGEGYPIPPKQVVEKDSSATEPPTPTLLGYKFDGWIYSSGNYTVTWDFAMPVTKDMTLTAHWTELVKYTVSFNVNGGNPPTLATVEVDENTTVPEPTVTAPAGYYLDAWYYNSTVWDFSTPVTSNMTLKARWFPIGATIDTVTFYFAPELTPPSTQQRVVRDSVAERPAIDPIRFGYDFGNWYSDTTTAITPWNFTTPITSNTTLYAKWVASTNVGHTVTISDAIEIGQGQGQYLVNCDTAVKSVFLTIKTDDASAKVLQNGKQVPGNTFIVPTNSPGITNISYTIRSFAGTVATDTIILVIPFPFDAVISIRDYGKSSIPSKVLIVNNDTHLNGGYQFTAFQWCRDTVKLTDANLQHYRVLDSAQYSVILTTAQGDLHVCSKPVGTSNGYAQLTVYPNPVSLGGQITLAGIPEGTETIKIYDITGYLIDTQTIAGTTRSTPLRTSVRLPSLTGLYIIQAGRETVKILIK